MACLQIHLLGGFAVRARRGPRVLQAKKSRALLAYLALPAGRFHSRRKLTGLLWGESAEAQAQQSFRQALMAVRRTLGDPPSGALVSEGDAIALRPSEVMVDVADFQAAAAEGSLDGLQRAASLYRGDLLDGLAVDEPPFEEWHRAERERLRELALEVLAKLLREQLGGDPAEPAIQTALRILGMDPLQEAVHRTLMRLFVGQGRRSAALRQYQQCTGWLARELGTQPDAETQELYRMILRTSVPVVAGRASAARLPNGRQSPSPESPLVGRRSEVEALLAALDGAFDGGAHVAVISGESGIGKTRLIQEFAASPRAEGLRMCVAWCHATEQPLPFRPWIDALRGDEASLRPHLTVALTAQARIHLARVFPELAATGRHVVTTDEHGPLFEAMRELIERLAGEQPTVIVLEDLQWCDDMSARLLAFLARRLAALPVLIVGTIRPEDAVARSILQQALAELRGTGQLHEIVLGALDRDDSLTLARAIGGGKRDPAIVEGIEDDLWKLSEGNPFVIVETLRALTAAAGHVSARVPLLATSVRESVSRRLACLPEESRQVLEVAAVIGRSFQFRLLLDVAGLDERACAAAIDELVRHRVLEAIDERLAFSHDRIRRVAYDDLLPRRRALLHRAVALALESAHQDRLDDVADELGRHFLRAGDVQKALVYLVSTAEIAAQRYAADSALKVLQQAADAADTLPAAERDKWRLDVALRRAFILTNGGRHGECLELVRSQASLQQRVADRSLRSEYFLRLAMSHAYLGAFAESRTAGEAALREGERAGRDDCIGKALYALASSSYGCGIPREAVAYDTRAIALLDRPHTRYWLGVTHWNLAASQHMTGEFSAALDSATRCEQIADSIGDCKLRSLAYCITSRVHSARGDERLAHECAQRALDTSRDSVSTFTALRTLGEAQYEAGDVQAAVRTFEHMLGIRQGTPAHLTAVWTLCCLGEAYLAAGDTGRAESMARRVLDVNAGVNPFNSALSWRLLGRIALARGDTDASHAHSTAALDAFERSGAAFEAGRTRLDLARTSASRHDDIGVQTHLAAAIRAFDGSGAPRRTALALELARALGIDTAVCGHLVPRRVCAESREPRD